MAFVVDASVVVGWLLQSQATPLTVAAEDALIGDTGWVPSHFGIEIARVLRRQERLGLIKPEIVNQAFARLCDLPLKQDTIPTLNLALRIVALARDYNLQIADAAYLELALRLDLALVTRDKALDRAAMKSGARTFTA